MKYFEIQAFKTFRAYVPVKQDKICRMCGYWMCRFNFFMTL